jgi:PCFT/HCP family folate transporter-like MFS transporter 1/3
MMSELNLPRSNDASSSTSCEEIQPVIIKQKTQASTRYHCWFTLELGIFLAMLGQAFSSTVVTQLLLLRNCQAMFPLNATKCDLLINKVDTPEGQQLEAVLQPHVTILQMYKTLIEACIPAVLSLFVGPWSDRHGRKPLILWPMFGMLLQF